jgi:hypothetical protein
MTGTLLGIIALGCNLGTGFIWFRRNNAVAIPEDRTFFVLAMSLGFCLGIAAVALGPGVGGGVAAGLAILLGGMFLFTVLIGDQKGGAGEFRVGQPVPDFSAPDENGEPFELASLAGRPVLLKFFRGHW